MQTYGKEVAETIIKCRQGTVWRLGVDGEHEKDDFIIKDDGVYPVKGVASSSQEFLGAVWRPACELDAQDKSTWLQPSLPIPFNEKHLAAFFMHGNGWYVRDSFGAWEDGPDDAVFDSMIDPDDDISSLVVPEVKKAVSAAYDAYRAAECVVGQFDNTLAFMAQKLDDAFWNAEDSLRTAELREALRIAHKKANDAEAAWRKQMVNQLLAVSQVTPVDSHIKELAPLAPAMVTTTQTTATPAPVVAVAPASDGPAKRSNRKPSWATVAKPYMKALFAAGDYKSATVFYKALMHRAGQSDSPFKLVNRELYCTEAGTTVSNGSLGNAWPGIRAQ